MFESAYSVYRSTPGIGIFWEILGFFGVFFGILFGFFGFLRDLGIFGTFGNFGSLNLDFFLGGGIHWICWDFPTLVYFGFRIWVFWGLVWNCWHFLLFEFIFWILWILKIYFLNFLDLYWILGILLVFLTFRFLWDFGDHLVLYGIFWIFCFLGGGDFSEKYTGVLRVIHPLVLYLSLIGHSSNSFIL